MLVIECMHGPGHAELRGKVRLPDFQILMRGAHCRDTAHACDPFRVGRWAESWDHEAKRGTKREPRRGRSVRDTLGENIDHRHAANDQGHPKDGGQVEFLAED